MRLTAFVATLAAGLLSLASAAPVAENIVAAQPPVIEITIQANKRHQQIEGFGFSGAFQRAQLLLNVTAQTQKELLDLLYSTETGIGFSILRNGIGSSNSSYNDWMNTILPESPGSPEGTFSYIWDAYDSGQFFLARQAVNYGVERIYANAWSAPGFMKTNRDDANGGLLCGVPGSEGLCEHDWRRAYADYLVRYIKFYRDAGIRITEVAWLNEPDLTTSYASMRSNAEQTADFLPILKKALREAGLDTNIACCELTGWQRTREKLAELKALGAEGLIDTWTGHEYTSAIDGPLDTAASVWQSEFCDLSGSWNPRWDTGSGSQGDGYVWAEILHRALAVGNVNAYLWWLAVQDEATNNNNNEKLIMVEDGRYYVAKRTWAFAQYSRHVRPGAWRVATGGGEDEGRRLKMTAFENKDASVVAVALNTERHEATVKLNLATCKLKRVSKVEAWLTDEDHDMERVEAVLHADGSVTSKVTARGLITIKLS